MLEFHDSFFEQEVKEGFYIDTTMKTVWAAEMEVLQHVAEICDKHNIKWYAAYGTLMGAIRHEGFVPWDDDMDIWVMRKDYNYLMKTLKDELPQGYIVQSAMNDVGYDQFHSCIINGQGIDISPSKLAEYHGCPFTVCLDVFPLDYLPRDEGQLHIQKNLFELAARVAQLAKRIGKNDFDSSDYEKDIEEATSEVLSAVEYIENFCSFRIDKTAMEEKNWHKIASELWRCANYIAMLYDESEADYIVEYLDYDQWDFKKYPKAWFETTYYATFENFMLPIPAGYEQILHLLYGDYMHFIPKLGCHEYPFYARQYRELKKYVLNVEKNAEKIGWISENQMLQDSIEIPTHWKQLIYKPNGNKKPLVLSANDPMYYTKQGMSALDELETTLRFFKNHSEDIMLWWRPHPVMGKVLEQISTEMSERYQKILNQYREEGWGICDESENVDRAVTNCEIYYGEMNAIIQTFQNASKPVILKSNEPEIAQENNRKLEKQYRAFINYTDSVEVDGKIYFSNNNYNALVIVDKVSNKIEEMIPFEGVDDATSDLHIKCVEKNGKICFLPFGDGPVHIFDTKSKKQKCIHLSEPMDFFHFTKPYREWNYYSYGDEIYLLPCHKDQGIWKWLVDKDCFIREEWWKIDAGTEVLVHGKVNENCFYTLEKHSNNLFITNIHEKNIEKMHLPNVGVSHIQYDGETFMYLVDEEPKIVTWDINEGIIAEHKMEVPDASWYRYMGKAFFEEFFSANERLVIISQNRDYIYFLKKKSKSVVNIGKIADDASFGLPEKIFTFKFEVNHCIGRMRSRNTVVDIDLESFKVKQYDTAFVLPENMLSYQNHIMIRRNALVYEESGNYDLNLLLRFLLEKVS